MRPSLACYNRLVSVTPNTGVRPMLNTALRDAVMRVLPRVKTPAQYIGGELNCIVKDHRQVRGKLCLCFPDAYTLGMSHHGLQVLYTIMNNDPQWACERAFTPWLDFEANCASNRLPLYGLETFTPLREFDVVGFSLQYEVCYTNVLTMLDLGGIPPARDGPHASTDPLVIAGGPGAQNPELLAPFVDLFVIGDGEESLPWVMEKWMALKERRDPRRRPVATAAGMDMLAELVGSTTWAYAPAFYEPEYHADGTIAAVNRTRADVPREIDGLHHHAGLRRHPAADEAGRAVRADAARPHRHRDHARLPVAVPLLPVHRHQAAAARALASRRSCRRPSRATATPGTNEISLLSLSTQRLPALRGAGASGCTRCSRRWA